MKAEEPIAVSRTSEGKASPEAAVQRSRFRRVASQIARLAAVVAVIIAVALPLGFFWFVSKLPTREVALDRNADGIVVLTGGASRVNDAFELLASGRGRRLLITGVYPATNRGEILRVLPEYQRLFACCVDLDRAAVNTLGNAIGARHWVQEQGFSSLIVVTSAYHMPRALAELSHQMPDVRLIPYPVVTSRLRTDQWWMQAETAKLLVLEYVKYIVAMIRIHIDPNSSATAPSRFSELQPGARTPIR